MKIQTALDDVRGAPSILVGIRRAHDLAVLAGQERGEHAVPLLVAAAADASDQVTAIAAVHALAQVPDESVDAALIPFLGHDALFLRAHAAWALGARAAQPNAVPALVDMVSAGGFVGMLAQRTLEEWSGSAPDLVADALDVALTRVADPAARARLVETAGRGPGSRIEHLLRIVAADANEGTDARAAAIAGLGDRRPGTATLATLTGLASRTDVLADVALLALFDLTGAFVPPSPEGNGGAVAQLFLHADLDRELTQVGAGDNGGIATLLVRLGDALVAAPAASDWAGALAPTGIERVVTMSRGRHDEALSCLTSLSSELRGHALATVPFLGDPPSLGEAWPLRIATQRGIHRVLRAAEPVTAIHLRMADVGSLAAAAVARERGIPVVFTLAPDPHGAIEVLETSGALTRDGFGAADAREHFWFRTRLVQRITADAAHLVLFPRPELERDLRRLLGVDLPREPSGRYSVVAEGIDLAVIDGARTEARVSASRRGGTGTSLPAITPDSPPSLTALGELDGLLRSLPPERQGLPLVVSVGRLHRVKGMATLVTAWADHPELSARSNLLVVGGDLEQPSDDEQEQLTLIDRSVPRAEAAARGLLLAGHRPNDTVARWLAAVRYGRPGLAAPRGVYVCASLKEEFGIALLEAMATGLLVVAPDSGGPAIYVEDAVTGFLVDTRDGVALADGVVAALGLAAGPKGEAGSRRGREMVAHRFTIGAMAEALTEVYTELGTPHPSLVPEVSAW